MRSRGFALIATLIALAVFSALGLGLLLTTSAERMAGNNHRGAVHALNAAEAALELAAREMALSPDWNAVLSGMEQSRYTDGLPAGVRGIAGMSIDLTTLTNQITCDRSTTCSDARVHTSTKERPWGANNPRWQPFLYGLLSSFTPMPPGVPDFYVIVWIGDDARERDGNPGVDGGAAGGEGRDVVRARADAFARGGARRAVEADFVRPCQEEEGVRTCGPGIRVQSWRVRTDGMP
jgi:type II secretory pathway pseudopilin PulG